MEKNSSYVLSDRGIYIYIYIYIYICIYIYIYDADSGVIWRGYEMLSK